uniref:Uncharacterized protein n=1 Tax=Panagrolaimus davidi TaxID=227884 RepID=A0A914PE42_9BILA
MAQIFALIVFIGFIVICFGCQSGMNDISRRIQEQYRQQCMQCPKLIVSQLCKYDSKERNVTCGKSNIDYYMHFLNGEICGKAKIHCSALPPKTVAAKLAIEQFLPLKNSNGKIGNGTLTDEEILNLNEESAAENVNDFEPFIFLTDKQKYYISSIVYCNKNGKWEIKTVKGKKVEGFEKIYCIVEKAF